MQVRVPRIARDLLEANVHGRLSARVREGVEALARSIEEDGPVPSPQPPAPDVESWAAAHAEHASGNPAKPAKPANFSWLHAEWFHVELAFYREIARVTRFWETGRDPFEPAKDEELAGDRPWQRLEQGLAGLAGMRARDERVAALLDACLWGNRVDLSYTVAASRDQRVDEDLLVDDRARILPRLVQPAAHVQLVADNTGAELALDLAVVDALLEDASARVTVHLKVQPVFVSDATARDLWRLLNRMDARGDALQALARRLRTAFDDGRLALAPDLFWSGPRFMWQAPDHLRHTLSQATAVVFKGDANYRRVVGDAPWKPDAPFADAASALGLPILCLRTMKSDSVLGLPAGLAERLDASDPRWRIDGRYGLAQAYAP